MTNQPTPSAEDPKATHRFGCGCQTCKHEVITNTTSAEETLEKVREANKQLAEWREKEKYGGGQRSSAIFDSIMANHFPEIAQLCEALHAEKKELMGFCERFEAVIEKRNKEIEALHARVQELEGAMANVVNQLITAEEAAAGYHKDNILGCFHCRIGSAIGTLEEALSPQSK